MFIKAKVYVNFDCLIQNNFQPLHTHLRSNRIDANRVTTNLVVVTTLNMVIFFGKNRKLVNLDLTVFFFSPHIGYAEF